MTRTLALAAALALIGCEGSSSPPFLLKVTGQPLNPFLIDLMWEPSGGTVTSYTVEGRVAGGAFVDLLPGSQEGFLGTGVVIELDKILPNGGPIELRVRADPGGVESNSLTYDPGPPLSSAKVTNTPDAASKAFVVTWGNPTTAQVVLERRIVQADATASAFVQITVASGPNHTFLDTDLSGWTDGALYEYRATASLAGAAASPSALTKPAPFLTPQLVSYGPAASGGAALVLLNMSAHATFLSVLVGDLDGVIDRPLPDFALPPLGGTVTVVDSTARVAVNAYKLEAGTNSDNFSASLVLQILQPSGAALQPKPVTAPLSDFAARDAAGNFCLVAPVFNLGAQVGATVTPPGTGGATLNLTTSVAPKCLIDAAGRPHAVLYEPPSASIEHVWYNGTVWQGELITTRPNPSIDDGRNFVTFDIGVDGTLFVAWLSGLGLELASSKAGGAWTVETVASPAPSGLVGVTGDENGAPHLVSLAFSSQHFFRAGAGAWTSEAIGNFEGLGAGVPVISVSAVGGTVSFVTSIENNFHIDANLLRRSSTGWTASALLLGSDFIAASRSADGHAFIVTSSFGDAVEIVRDGVSQLAPIGASNPNEGIFVPSTAAGFDPQGKPWVLEWLTPDFATAGLPLTNTAFLFEEQ